MGFKINTAQLEQPVVEQEVVNVEKPEDLQNQNASAVDLTNGASSSEDSSSEPSKYKHISFEDAKTAGTSKLSSIYPKVKIKKDSNGLINVTNIATGESKSFLLDQKEINKTNNDLQSRDYMGVNPSLTPSADEQYESFTAFVEASETNDEDALYIHRKTGLTPDENGDYGFGSNVKATKNLVQTLEVAYKQAYNRLAGEIAGDDKNSFLLSKRNDFQNLNHSDQEKIREYTFDFLKQEQIAGNIGFKDLELKDISKIIDRNEFKYLLNEELQNEANSEIIATKQFKDINLEGNVEKTFINKLEKEIYNEMSDEDKARVADISALRLLKSERADIASKYGEYSKEKYNTIIDLTNGASMPYGEYINKNNIKVRDIEAKVGDLIFNERGDFKGETKEEAEANMLTLEAIYSMLEDTDDYVSQKEQFKLLYDEEKKLAIFNDKVGNTSMITIPADLINQPIFKTAMGGVGESFKANLMVMAMRMGKKLKTGEIGVQEEITIPFSEYYKFGIDNSEISGVLDEAMLGTDPEKFRAYEAWLSDKREHKRNMVAAFNMLNLEELPEKSFKDSFFPRLARKTLEAFKSSDFYFGGTEESVKQTSRAIFGVDVQDMQASMQSIIDLHNKKFPENTINLSDKQKEKLASTTSDLVAEGLGGMVPFLFEMFVIGAATEGVGIPAALTRYKRFNKILKGTEVLIKEEVKMGLAPSTPYEFGVGAFFAAGGILANKIPIKAFNKYFTSLRPFYEKVVRAGWVGAASTKANEVVQAFGNDLLGDKDFATEMNNLYGDLLAGDGEAKKEFVQSLIVDGMVFGLSGISHLKLNPQSRKQQLKALVELQKDYNKTLLDAKEQFKGVDGKKLTNDQVVEQLAKLAESNNPEAKAIYDKLYSKGVILNNAAKMIAVGNQSIDFNNKENFKTQYIDKLNKSMANKAREAGLEPMETTVEFVKEGDANFALLDGGAAKFMPVKGGGYKLIYDVAKFNKGKAMHEIDHVVQAEMYRRQPELKKLVKSKATNGEIGKGLLSGVDKIGLVGEQNPENLKSLMKLLRKEYGLGTKANMSDAEILELEYSANLIEIFSNPETLAENPMEAATFFGELKNDYLAFYDRVIRPNLPEGFKPRKPGTMTVNDLYRQLNYMAKDVGLSEASINFMEDLMKVDKGIGELNIDTDIVQGAENIKATEKRVLDKVMEEQGLSSMDSYSDFLKEYTKSPEKAYADGEKTSEEVREKGNSQAMTDRIVMENLDLVNVIANSSKSYTVGKSKRKLNLFLPPKAQRDKIAGKLMEKLIFYAGRYDGRGNVRGYLDRYMSLQIPNIMRDLKIFDQMKFEVNESDLAPRFDGRGLTIDQIAREHTTQFESGEITIEDLNTTIDLTPTRITEAANKKIIGDEVEFSNFLNEEITRINDDPKTYDAVTDLTPVGFYESHYGVKDKKITVDRQISINEGGAGKKEVKSATEKLFAPDGEITTQNKVETISKILPEAYVKYGKTFRANNDEITVSDEVAGTSTGVTTTILGSPFYRKVIDPQTGKQARVGDAAGLPIYRKVPIEELDINAVTEYFGFNVEYNRQIGNRVPRLIRSIHKAFSHQAQENFNRSELSEVTSVAEQMDLAGGASAELMAFGSYEALVNEYNIRDLGDAVKTLEDIKTYVSDPMQLDDVTRNLIHNITINNVSSQLEKKSNQFKAEIKKRTGYSTTTFKNASKEGQAEIRKDHMNMLENFFGSEYVNNILNIKVGKGSKEDALLPIFKFGSVNRGIDNAGGPEGVKFSNMVKGLKEVKLEDIKDEQLREGYRKLKELAPYFEAANSDINKGKGFDKMNTSMIFEIAEAKPLKSFHTLVDKNGKKFLWDPSGKLEYNAKDYPQAMEIVRGSTVQDKLNLIDKVFDKKVVEAARTYDFVVNRALGLWYNNLPKEMKSKGKEFLYRHYQATTNFVKSDRAFAAFKYIQLFDGQQTFHKKGEHIVDASTNTLEKFIAITEQGGYSKATHELLSNYYYQALTETARSKVMDKLLGPTTPDAIYKMAIKSDGSFLFDNVYNIFDLGKRKKPGTILDDIVETELKEELKKGAENYVKKHAPDLNSTAVKTIAEASDGNIQLIPFEAKDAAIMSNVDVYVERKIQGLRKEKGEDYQPTPSEMGKIMGEARKLTATVEPFAVKTGSNIVMDGTGASYNATTKRANKLKLDGYEVIMVYVDTKPEVALERNRKRERRLLDIVVKRTGESVKKNEKLYKKDFGDNFFYIDNTMLAQGETPVEFINSVRSKFKDNKVAVLMAGGPGSGKSSVLKDLALTSTEMANLSRQVEINKNKTEIDEATIGDFDDNIAYTDCKITATKGDEVIKLNAKEFNFQKEALEADGYKMSYEEFDQVIGGKEGPYWQRWTNDYKRIGPENMFIMTARAGGSKQAIAEWLKSKGYEIPVENIVTTEGTEFTEGPLAGENKKAVAITDFYVGKYNGKQYNKINFGDDYIPNTASVKFVINQLDVTGEVYTTLASRDIGKEFNNYLSESTGLDPDLIVDYSTAVKAGSKKDKFKMMPYSAEDFNGLLYATLGKSKQGEKQYEFYKETLLDPYERGIQAFETDMVAVNRRFKQIKKQAPKGLNDVIEGSVFTKQDAVRVFLWNQTGKKIPGLGEAQVNKLVESVKNDPALEKFAGEVLEATGEGMYSEPTESWNVGTITTDLMELGNTVKRKRYLTEFLNNKDQVFSKDNLNKLRAQYGNKYVEALENTLQRMELGRNRIGSRSKTANRVLDYINNTNGVTMFLNTRSAVLQTISAANYVNWSFNNPLKAAGAIANQPQYWKDFIELMNDDFLVNRREGNKINISENEIAEAASGESGIKGAMSYLLDKGYSFTKYADSFAIASGGATYYRNRINDLVKREGISEVDAKVKAREEWIKLARESQQSGDPSRISEQQSSDLGRLTLAFANTPMQYVRIQKRAIQDIKAGRGDTKANFSKLLYYGFIQNVMFNSLQQALFAADEDNIDEKTLNTIEGMIDSQLRGTGMFGNAVVMGKNVIEDVYKRSKKDRPEYIDAVWKVTSIAPGINSKISKLKTTGYLVDNKIDELPGPVSFNNPALQATTSATEAVTNLPVERVRRKIQNVIDATNQENEYWQSIAMLLGWPKWQLIDEDEDFLNTERFEEEKKKQRESFFGRGTSNSEKKDRSNFGF